MNKIIFPLDTTSTGDNVTNLQNALESLGYPISSADKKNKKFATSTKTAVSNFQKENKIEATGIIDESTAIAINQAIQDKDVLDELKIHSKNLGDDGPINRTLNEVIGKRLDADGPINKTLNEVIGKRLDADGPINKTLNEVIGKRLDAEGPINKTLNEAIGKRLDDDGPINSSLKGVSDKLDQLNPSEPPLALNSKGEKVKALHNDLIALGYTIPTHEKENGLFGAGTRTALIDFQKRYELKATGILDAITRAAIRNAIAGVTDGKKHFHVEGRAYFDFGVPAKGTTLKLYNKTFGNIADDSLDTCTVDDFGFFILTYEVTDAGKNLEIRVLDKDKKEISISNTQFNTQKNKLLHLIIPGNISTQDSEYKRLTKELKPHVGDLENLAEAKEGDEGRQDLSVLNQKTKWDARLIGFSAKAAKLAKETGLGKEALYGLFRYGLPMDKESLSLLNADSFEKILKKAAADNIVPLNETQIAQAKTAFNTFSKTTRFAMKAPGTLSKISDFRDATKNLGLTNKEIETFANIFIDHTGNEKELWAKVKNAGIADTKIEKLQIQGKFAQLTQNNSVLTTSLMNEIKDAQATKTVNQKVSGLAEKNFYKKDKWKDFIKKAATSNNIELKNLIPSAFIEGDIEKSLESYADEMARKVRISFPTTVVRTMFVNKELGFKNDNNNSELMQCLQRAEEKGFKLGKTRLGKFIKEQENVLFAGMTSEKKKAAIQKMRTLQRIYQITPSNDSLKVMLELGFTSAQDVTHFSKAEFLKFFGGKFSSLKEAELIFRKSEQVSSVSHTFYGAVKQMRSAPSLAAVSPQPEKMQQAVKDLIKEYPTMESLFGSQDYLECEHSCSVLSPAAYFVDLLQLLDLSTNKWDSTIAYWKMTHNNAVYPFSMPYNVLCERRPDLPNLALTTENTDTAIPYIDVVNEIMEYYIVHGGLDNNIVYNTETTEAPELLAEPQNIIPEAYNDTNLGKAKYPLSLPFDLWLETVRQFINHFDVLFSHVLNSFRLTEELFAPQGIREEDKPPYYRVQIFSEALCISPEEYNIFTDSKFINEWYSLYGYADEQNAKKDIQYVKNFARRLGISYKEIIEIVETGFVNPYLINFERLKKLGIEIIDIFRFKKQAGFTPFTAAEETAFRNRLANLPEPYTGFNALEWINATWAKDGFKNIIDIEAYESASLFDKSKLFYVERKGEAASSIAGLDFHKINIFVRLWKKLGWQIEDVDRALQVFLPENAVPLTKENWSGALKSALVYIAHVNELKKRLKADKDGIQKLLTIWAPFFTTSKNTLYERFFLHPNALKKDSVFYNPLKQYLSDPNVFLKDHILSLQGAFNLTANDIHLILTHEAVDIETVKLSLPGISLLYRFKMLSQCTGLSVADFIDIMDLTGINPFNPLSKEALTKIEEDKPLINVIQFVNIVEKIKSIEFKVEDLNFILRHKFDPLGKYRDNEETFLNFLRQIIIGKAAIKTEYPMPENPAALTDEKIQEIVGLIFPKETADIFLSLWKGTRVYSALQKNVKLVDSLNPITFLDFPSLEVYYDETREIQHLSYRGALVETEKNKIKTKSNSSILLAFLNDVQTEAKSFFTMYLAHYFKEEDYDLFFTPGDKDDAPEIQQEKIKAKNTRFIQALFPDFQKQLFYQLVIEKLNKELSWEPSFIRMLITNPAYISDPDEPGKSSIDVFAKADVKGISVRYFASDNAEGKFIKEEIISSLTTEYKPAGTKSVVFHGYLEVPINGAYRFFIVLENSTTAEAELKFKHLPDPVVQCKIQDAVKDKFIELDAGKLYDFTFTLKKLGTGNGSLLVQGQNLPKGPANNLSLYPCSNVEQIKKVYFLIAKTFKLINGFALNQNEVQYILTHPANFGNINLNKLPTLPAEDSPAQRIVLLNQFIKLVDYSSLRKSMGDTDDLITVFNESHRVLLDTVNENEAKEKFIDNLCDIFAALTRRNKTTVRTAIEYLHFKIDSNKTDGKLILKCSGFSDITLLVKLLEILQIVEMLGIDFNILADSLKIVSPVIDYAKKYGIAEKFKNTVRAKYETDSWMRIAQSIFDKLRKQKRDALAAYIIAGKTKTVDNMYSIEKLYEDFLIDPGMEPVVLTSRLQLAISSVQLFIQRCLLNLEPKVSPAAINSRHWRWMKRYRVWEANRKIFLYPENWLEPEFRDDKTHLNQEMESALLQGDVSSQLVEDAFFNYLKKLEELARLELVTVYCQEIQNDPESNILHVIGRTYSDPRKYFYRTYANQMWTPWIPVDAEIEGNHIVAVVWRERLNIFWLSFLDKPDNSANNNSDLYEIAEKKVGDINPYKYVEIILNWCEYYQGQWTTRQSGGTTNPLRVKVSNAFDRQTVTLHVSKEYEEDIDYVLIHIHLMEAVLNQQLLTANNNLMSSNLRAMNPNITVRQTETRIQQYPNMINPNLTVIGAIADLLNADYTLTPVTHTFKIVSKNSQPQIDGTTEELPALPYVGHTPKETYREGSWNFRVKYTSKIKTGDDNTNEVTETTADIFAKTDRHEIVPCVNSLELMREDIRNFVSPLFYQDSQHTFFIEPDLTEETMDVWESWVIPVVQPEKIPITDEELNKIKVEAHHPKHEDTIPADPASKFSIKSQEDWIKSSGVALKFGSELVGERGGMNSSLKAIK